MSSWDEDYCYEPAPLFEETFRCLPFDKYKDPALESGNRIVMPPSSLSVLSDLPVRYPIMFKIETYAPDHKTTHCGVLEFTADEGSVYMPRWMMENLEVEEGENVVLRNAALPKGGFMMLRPHETAFVELSNPRAVLEQQLRGYACVSRGDRILVSYNGRDFYLDVVAVSAGNVAISLIETDCIIEFAPALDYVEPPPPPPVVEGESEKVEDINAKIIPEGVKEFKPFTGLRRRLRGTKERDGCSAMEESPVRAAATEGNKAEEDDGREKFKAFTGRGRVLGASSSAN